MDNAFKVGLKVQVLADGRTGMVRYLCEGRGGKVAVVKIDGADTMKVVALSGLALVDLPTNSDPHTTVSSPSQVYAP